MFTLAVDQKIETASVLVRWRLDAETKEMLVRHAKGKPMLLIVVIAAPSLKETRILVPLERAMQYVPIYHPGVNTILSAIVWDKSGQGKSLYRTYLNRYRGEYTTTSFLDYEGAKPILDDRIHYWNLFTPGIAGPSIEVVIPKEVFAKEPPKWEQGWVNFLYKEPQVDQCEYRKRRLVAYTVQLPIVLTVLAAMVLWALLVGLAGMLFFGAGFYRPALKLGFKNRWDDMWNATVNRNNNFWYLAYEKIRGFFSREDAVARETRVAEENRLRILREEEAHHASLQHMYELLSGAQGSHFPVPPPNQRIVLFFQEVKAQVCKPFAG